MTSVDQETNRFENPQVIYSWKAPLRAYKKRSAGVLRFYIAIAFLLSLIVFFINDKILIIPIWAVMFLFYVLTITPPPEVTNKITKFGVESVGNMYHFDALSHFYFIKRFDYNVLILVSHAPYFYHIYLVVKEEREKREIISILSRHLVYQEHPKKTLSDKVNDWLSSLMPQDDEITQKTKEPQVAASNLGEESL